jgi:hypothetical protein
VDRGIPIIAPVHDAIMVEGPADCIEDISAEMTRCMVEASQHVLGGPMVRVDAKSLLYPGRYVDGRNQELWDKTLELLTKIKRRTA